MFGLYGLTEEEILEAMNKEENFELNMLYLVKWKGQSYLNATWEPYFLFKGIFEDKLEDFRQFNRSPETWQRNKLDSLLNHHKKMSRMHENRRQYSEE